MAFRSLKIGWQWLTSYCASLRSCFLLRAMALILFADVSFCQKSELTLTRFLCMYAFQPAGNLQIRGCKKASGSLKIAVQCVSRSCLVKLSLERFFSEGIPFGGHGGNPALMERT